MMSSLPGLQDLTAKVKDATAVAQQLSTLSKSTSAQSSGHHFRELCRLSFQSEFAAQQLCDLLISGISSTSPSIKRLRTLKTLRRVSEEGSRAFRRRLRKKDYVLKAAESAGGGAEDPNHGDVDARAREEAKELRAFLFTEDLLSQDEDDEVEALPDKLKTTLSGMGSSAKGNTGDGFGNSPLEKGSLSHTVLDFFDRVLSPSVDEKVMMEELLMKPSTTGKYEPVEINVTRSLPSEDKKPIVRTAKRPAAPHVRGRAGGGWESEDSEEEERDQLEKAIAMISVRSDESFVKSPTANLGETSLPEEEKDSTQLEDSLLKEFCTRESFPSTMELSETFERASQLNCLSVLLLLGNALEASDEDIPILRSLLLVEYFLRSGVIRGESYHSVLGQRLSTLLDHKSERIRLKAEKIAITISML